MFFYLYSCIRYIEQPAGVGFSTAPSGTAYGDEMAANDNYAFIMGFLEKFPQYDSSQKPPLFTFCHPWSLLGTRTVIFTSRVSRTAATICRHWLKSLSIMEEFPLRVSLSAIPSRGCLIETLVNLGHCTIINRCHHPLLYFPCVLPTLSPSQVLRMFVARVSPHSLPSLGVCF